MNEHNLLAAKFEAHRTHLGRVAYRMLGSRSEAEDAVQEAWLRLGRFSAAGGPAIDNLGGWLTTVVSRVCLDMLRSRNARREDPQGPRAPEAASDDANHPEHERQLADSVGHALLVVLQTLPPAERVAFVLHDMFDVPFDEIADIVDRTPTAARQLASRARRRVSGAAADPDADLAGQRSVVDAFLTAARGGDMQALLAVLAPDVVFRTDAAGVRAGSPGELRGHDAVARNFAGRAQAARPTMVDGALGLAVYPEGRLLVVLRLTIVDGQIAEIDAVADPSHLARLDLQPLEA
jgi:RNA polymerase sigma-70 factor (ECF subfamily)